MDRKLANNDYFSYSSPEEDSIDASMHVSFCAVMCFKGPVERNSSYMKLLCGLSRVTRL